MPQLLAEAQINPNIMSLLQLVERASQEKGRANSVMQKASAGSKRPNARRNLLGFRDVLFAQSRRMAGRFAGAGQCAWG